ncbi:hypothetical protein JCM1841_001004 [Sporobolomyces salmonicolor]
MASLPAELPPLLAGASPSSRSSQPTLDTNDFLETRSVQLEWKVSNLKQLFDGTKGEAKSKCVKSALFDSSRWQIFLYPNSGHEQYVSLYLSCEPTAAEKERGMAELSTLDPPRLGAGRDAKDGKEKEKDRIPWRRDGRFKFTFEARSIDRRMTFKQMEADNHSFSSKERNWGYQSFWRRNEAYYNNQLTRAADAFLIICTIVSSPTLPTTPPLPHLLIPKDLVNSFASLFDDPDYSDVVFRIRPESTGKQKVREKRLYAAKKVLAGRSEYFDMMFNSGFTESTYTTYPAASTATSTDASQAFDELNDEGEFESSSDEDDDSGFDEDDDSAVDESDREDEELDGDEHHTPSSLLTGQTHTFSAAAPASPDVSTSASTVRPAESISSAPRSRTSSTAVPNEGAGDSESASGDRSEDEEGMTEPTVNSGFAPESSAIPPLQPKREAPFVDAPSAPPSPAGPGNSTVVVPFQLKKAPKPADLRPRFEVVVTDAAYSTLRALLNYLYTDSISFSPLASTYYVAREHAAASGLPFPYASRKAYLLAHSPAHAPEASGKGKVGPCSAKAIYRLADKMGLSELKERAYEHIVQSLTAQNIVYEAFGSFSMRFEEIKRIEIAFLLDKWLEVRSSPSMRKVFEYLRSGRFPGFEDVWLRIMENLEYRTPGGAGESEERM